MAKWHPFVRMTGKDQYEYGVYTEGAASPDRIMGTAPSRADGYRGIIATLRKENASLLAKAGLCLGAGMALIGWAVLANY